MLQAQSKVTSQGQVSVPAPVRQALGLTAGASIEWFEDEQGRIVVRRAARHSSEQAHDALFPQGPPSPAVSLTQLKAGLRQNIRARHEGR